MKMSFDTLIELKRFQMTILETQFHNRQFTLLMVEKIFQDVL